MNRDVENPYESPQSELLGTEDAAKPQSQRLVGCVQVVFAVLGLVLIALGILWLANFLFTSYREQFWIVGIGAGVTAFGTGSALLWAAYRLGARH